MLKVMLTQVYGIVALMQAFYLIMVVLIKRLLILTIEVKRQMHLWGLQPD